MTAVAEYLHERCPYEVSQRADATRPFPEPSPSRAQVFIAHAHGWTNERVTHFLHELRGGALLLFLERSEVASALASALSTDEHEQADTINPFLFFERNAAVPGTSWASPAAASLIDFVWTHHDLDHVELTETALRVHRLATLAESSRSAPAQGVHDPDSGRIDADRIATFLGISLRQLAQVCGWNYTTVHKTPDAPSVQEALGPFARTFELLNKLHPNAQSARSWLNTPHREFDERTPLQVMLDGRADAVRDMLEAAYLGLPT
ncbi:MAG: hypothetical protein RLZZ450_2738 [Pseudomonadota bacterium]